MMNLPTSGAASADLRHAAHQDWMEAAAKAGLDLTGFDPDAPFEERVDWAVRAGLVIGCVYVRFSSKNQHSTRDQVRANVVFAAANGMYVPPELICVDEAEKGRRVRRDGLQRLKLILKARLATVMLVYKASRLFRQAYLGYQLIEQEVVEEGLRAVSVSQGIDTKDKKVWKAQIQLYGMLDDLLLDAIGDHVREGLIGLFNAGYVTGALTIGYRREEIPNAPRTNRGLPRTQPAIDEKAAELIREHAGWLLEGMPLREGVRRWRAADGPSDPRATTGQMSYEAYRHLFTNERLTGRWEFGRKRNVWSSKRDYTRQIAQPDEEVVDKHREDLRILSDEIFYAVKGKIEAKKTGPRGPRKTKEPRLCDLVTDVFHCVRCGRRFHTCGAGVQSMHCPEPDCPAHAMVNRAEAVAAVCDELAIMLADNQTVVEQLTSAVQRLAAHGDDVKCDATEMERKIRGLTNRIHDLTELAGEGTEADRAEMKAKIRAAQSERMGLQLALTRLRQATASPPMVTAAAVQQVLSDFGSLLRDGAAGKLGSDAVYRAVEMFRKLVGGHITVVVEVRAGRKRGVVRGRFTPALLATASEEVGVTVPSADLTSPGEVEVWLRQPPRLDAIANEVRRWYEDEGLGFRAIAKRLSIGCGNVYQSYKRFYEMRGLPVPPRRPRGRRRSA